MSANAPGTFMQSLIGKRVEVKSKWGTHYTAHLVSTDSFMNLLLRDCTERTATEDPDAEPSVMSDVLIRCNNVLYVRELVA